MSERERWVVYPLLFLALGAALRDKFGDVTVKKSIVCEELTVVDDTADFPQNAHLLAKIERAPDSQAGGILAVNGGLEVAGILNANQYAIQGHLLTPTFQQMFEFFRWLQAAQQQQRGAVQGVPSTNPPAGSPPAVKSNDDTNAAPPTSKPEADAAKEN
jgi:hypothetical protein